MVDIHPGSAIVEPMTPELYLYSFSRRPSRLYSTHTPAVKMISTDPQCAVDGHSRERSQTGDKGDPQGQAIPSHLVDTWMQIVQQTSDSKLLVVKEGFSKALEPASLRFQAPILHGQNSPTSGS